MSKILFLSHRFYPDIGGIEIISELLAENFVKAGYEVHLMTWSTDTTNKIFPYKVIRNPSTRTLLKEHRWADIVFENNPCVQLGWPKLIFRKPSVITLQTWISRTNGIVNWKDKLKINLWLRNAKKVVAVSQRVADKTWSDSTIIGNPYRQENFKILTNIERDRNFIFVGRLVSDKGAELAIRAVKKITELSKSSPEPAKPTLTIVGNGPELSSLKELAEQENISAQVEFTGSLSGQALVQKLNQHSILIVPSLWEEPFGVVALEGIACGCTAIVSDGGGLPEAVGQAGYTFSRGNIDSLVQQIVSVQTDDQGREQRSKMASEHLAAFHPEKISRKYLNLIEAILN